jgi:serine/threonine-protein kinase
MRQTRRLGRYHVTERIAYGGMAEIFRGFTYDRDGFRRDVAIKKLLPHYREDQQFVTMLTDEFKLVSHLRHPSIAEVYELADVEGALLIVMEYVDGKDLRSTVEKAYERALTIPLDDIIYLMARALDGLHHAHEARDDAGQPLNIVHRDVSPANILLTYDGRVKICDFGIAKAKLNRIQTQAGIIKGKVKYMSPEQAFGRALDPRSDVFSAGSVLYELCTNRSPFKAANERELIYTVREAKPVPVEEANPNIPRELASIVHRAMARDRAERYASAAAFRDDLLAFLQRYNAGYRRTKLGRFMKKLWAREIDSELRALEDFVLDLGDPAQESYGRNLIADALGPDAAYARFSPHPTKPTQTVKRPAARRQGSADEEDPACAEESTAKTPGNGSGG